MPVQTCLQLVVSKTATVGPFCGSADSQGYKSRCSRAIERLKIYVPPLVRAKGSSWKQPIHAIDERFDNIIHIACRVEQSARLSSPNWVADATSQSRKGCAMFVGNTAVPTIASSDCVPLSDIAQSTSPLQSQIFFASADTAEHGYLETERNNLHLTHTSLCPTDTICKCDGAARPIKSGEKQWVSRIGGTPLIVWCKTMR
jgi:hypothetical protein